MNLTEFLIQEKIDGISIPPSKNDERAYREYAGREHNARVLRLGIHLIKTKEFDRVYPFWQYKKGGFEGEVDLLAEKKDFQAWFEIKFKFKPRNLEKAINQFQKYKNAFPEFNGKAYYVSCDGMVIEISNQEVLDQF